MLEKSVVEFVAKFTGTPVGKVSLNSKLFHDLGVDGDDGTELIETFCEEYQVEFEPPEGEEYYGPEASPNPFALLWWFVSPAYRRGELLTPIRIRDLVVSAKNKKWTVEHRR